MGTSLATHLINVLEKHWEVAGALGVTIFTLPVRASEIDAFPWHKETTRQVLEFCVYDRLGEGRRTWQGGTSPPSASSG